MLRYKLKKVASNKQMLDTISAVKYTFSLYLFKYLFIP